MAFVVCIARDIYLFHGRAAHEDQSSLQWGEFSYTLIEFTPVMMTDAQLKLDMQEKHA